MARLHLLALLLLTLLAFEACCVQRAAAARPGKTAMAKIHKYLKKHKRPAVKTVTMEDGDVVDCVKVEDQISMQDARARGHQIQMAGPNVPDTMKTTPKASHTLQTWGSCPKGTVPVRRIPLDEMMRAGSVAQYMAKYPASMQKAPQSHSEIAAESLPARQGLTAGMMAAANGSAHIPKHALERPSVAGHEYAITQYPKTSTAAIYGSKAVYNIWNPYVQYADEFSLTQTWLVAGSYGAGDLNTIEVGHQLYPAKYGDYASRLFIYWTRDAYKTTGCYNLDCSGFIQTNNAVFIGGKISPVSSYAGAQYEYTVLVFKDPSSKNWWLQYQGQWVGYWPYWLFNRLNSYANVAQWGGEIVNNEHNGKHTGTYMGSGWYASKGYSYAAYVRNVQYVNAYNTLINTNNQLASSVTNSNCYSILVGSNPGGWESYFYFGGIGYSSICP